MRVEDRAWILEHAIARIDAVRLNGRDCRLVHATRADTATIAAADWADVADAPGPFADRELVAGGPAARRGAAGTAS